MISKASFVFLSIIIFTSSQAQSSIDGKGLSTTSVWQETIGRLLKQPLWKTKDSYDAGHTLMIPLHHAFVTHDRVAIAQFEDFFDTMGRAELPEGQLNQVHILYLASQYLVLKKKATKLEDPADVFLAKRILKYILIKWKHDIAFQWGKPPFFGLKNRLDYALQNQTPENEPSYYRVITDYELFLFAIASDMGFVLKGLKMYDDGDRALLNEINEYLLTVLKSRGSFTENGGWLFQAGFWTDHPYFAYSGNLELGENLQPKKVEDITKDSSHAHRWPLWLMSYYHGNENNTELLSKIYLAFSKQFNHNIAVKVQKGVFINNFVTGYNGIYRYKYKTTKNGLLEGYGPYNLSGTLGIAWYCFLKDTEDFYRRYKNSYPLDKEILSVYVGPNTSRKRNELFQWPDFFTNGLAKLIAEQAYEISKNDTFEIVK
ncbi:hypothetical protein [Pareuzebyella sediminis]|uniref:hypothetical protein n=1 Tax=Pareuzebyella sediminis TaxID=2607998 RepID=UPI0011ED01B0|nr:hypothetical protein [Pareuzebyella sediminis]